MSRESVTAYKAFTEDWTCEGFKYEIGKTYRIEGKPIMYRRGFHAFRNPDLALRYLPTSKHPRFARVRLAGEMIEEDGTICASEITVERELDWAEFSRLACFWGGGGTFLGFGPQDKQFCRAVASWLAGIVRHVENWSKK